MKKTLYKTNTLFDLINAKLKEENLLPDILDYSLATSSPLPVKTIEWDTIGIVNFGGCEGIYLDIYLEGDTGNDADRILLGTYKTLYRDKESFRVMGNLNTEFVFALREFVNSHPDDFNWTGYDIRFYKGDKKTGGYWSSTENSSMRLIKRHFKEYSPDHAVLIDNSTGKEKTIQNVAN